MFVFRIGATHPAASPIPVVSIVDEGVTDEDIADLKAVARKFMRMDRQQAKVVKCTFKQSPLLFALNQIDGTLCGHF